MAESDPDMRERRVDGPGRRLRLARERRKLTVEQAADSLHLDTATIEAVESDDYDGLPPATFVRGYLKNYARLVGVDEGEVLEAYGTLGLRDPERPLHNPITAPSGPSLGHRLVPWLAVLVIAAGVAGAGWGAWQSGVADGIVARVTAVFGPEATDNRIALPASGEESPAMSADGEPVTAQGATSPDTDEAVAPADDAATSEGPGDEAPEAVVRSESVPVDPGSYEVVPGQLTANAPVAREETAPNDSAEPPPAEPGAGVAAEGDADVSESAAAAAGVAESAAVPDQATSAANTVDPTATASSSVVESRLETLAFTFSGDAWMEVVDARGERLIFEMVSGERSRVVRGVPPFRIVVGDVGNVEVTYEGTPLELDPYTRGRVARLTLGDG